MKGHGSGSYASDRFYLNHIPYESFRPFPPTSAEETEEACNQRHCTQYFDRARYFQQVLQREEVQCVLLSSYRLDWEVIQAQFAPCFQAKASVPLLVLHGEKKDGFGAFMDALQSSTKRSNYLREEDLEMSENEAEDGVQRQQDREASWRHKLWGNDLASSLACQVEVWEVMPQWIIESLPVNHPKRYIPGVHHPKYMLIFTQQGLHVSISTANLTVNGSVDACWVQFFPRCCRLEHQDRRPQSDFGVVLEDFIRMQSKQLRSEDLSHPSCFGDLHHDGVTRDIMLWVEAQTGSQTLAKDFDFSAASAALVSSVPCRKPLPALSAEEKKLLYELYDYDMDLVAACPCNTCGIEAEKIALGADGDILYGSKRIRTLLEQQMGTYPRLSQRDLLFLQPTSIGIGLDNSYMGGLLEDYMPETIWDDDFEVLRSERWRMIWPSRDAMIDMQRCSSTSPNATKDNNENEADLNANIVQGILFFHPKSFTLMETDIQTQFFTYAPSTAAGISQVSRKYSPHIKSYCRLVDEEASKDKRCKGSMQCCCYDIAWALVTSACLSKGAQGVQCPYSICASCRHIRQGYVEYRNFELGVLLTSTEDKQYQALCGSCPVHGQRSDFAETAVNKPPAGDKTTVVLPFPYDLYHDSEAFCNDVGKVQIDLYYNPPATEGMKYASAYREDSVLLKRRSTTPTNLSKDPVTTSSKEGNTVLGRRSFSMLNTDQLAAHDEHSSVVSKPNKTPHKKLMIHGKENQEVHFSSLDTFQLVRNQTHLARHRRSPVSDEAALPSKALMEVKFRSEVEEIFINDYQEFTSTEVEDNDEDDNQDCKQVVSVPVVPETNITHFLC